MSFQFVKPTDEQIAEMQTYRDLYQSLADRLLGYKLKNGSSPGLSLALTKLEESAMWLNKAITKND